MLTNAVRPNLLTAQVVEQLERLIFDAGLEPGSSLPSEAELIERFGVSRVVVREAIRALETRGLVRVRQGKRPIVNGLNATMPGDFFRVALRQDANVLLELIEVRRALEVHAAFLAAKRATEDDLKAMQGTIDAMEAKSKARSDDPEGFDDADADFHQRLAAASGNRLMRLLAEALRDPLRASRTASHRGRFARGLDDTAPIAAHRKILERVAAKDAEGAARAMELHLKESLEDLRAAQRSMDCGQEASTTNPE